MHTAVLRFTRILFHPTTLYVAAWFLALSIAAGRWFNARQCFDDDSRIDGNYGHRTIDFGGQWLMGRMITAGHARELYSRPVQKQVAHHAYSVENDTGEAGVKDADTMMDSFMGDAEGNGGPLYPPIQAFVMAPFALGDHPQRAYFIVQWFMLGYCFVAGLGVSLMSRGRIWWPIATALILSYPGCKGGIDLGQNSSMTMMLLIWGWAMIVRGHPILGGFIWGLLAFKPVWSVSFLLALVLLRQWRAGLAMAATGALIVLATLPVVGIHSWLDWLKIGQDAAALYNVDGNWIPLSRDLLGLPRRIFLDFQMPYKERDNLLARTMSVALWMFVFEVTIRVFFSRRDKSIPLTGPVPAFLFLAAWMCTYHFMYYDALIGLFGILVLLADPSPFLRRTQLKASTAADEPTPSFSRSKTYFNSFVLTMLGLTIFYENVARQLKLDATAVVGVHTSARTLNDGTTEPAPRLQIGAGDYYAWETGAVLILWMWCGGLIVWQDRAMPEPERFATTR